MKLSPEATEWKRIVTLHGKRLSAAIKSATKNIQ